MPGYMAPPVLQSKALIREQLMSKNILVFSAACSMFLFGIALITLGSVATDLRSKFQLSGTDAGTLFLYSSIWNSYRLINIWARLRSLWL